MILFSRILDTTPPTGAHVHHKHFQIILLLFLRQQLQHAVNTFGGWPASVNNLATSAFILFTIIIPPTVEPGDTGVSNPNI